MFCDMFRTNDHLTIVNVVRGRRLTKLKLKQTRPTPEGNAGPTRVPFPIRTRHIHPTHSHAHAHTYTYTYILDKPPTLMLRVQEELRNGVASSSTVWIQVDGVSDP